MAVYCADKKRRDWALGKNVCDGDSAKCKQLIRIGKQEYCGFSPPRCNVHQVVRSQAGCLFCKYATRNLNYTKCVECLSADNRINFEKDVEDNG